jgi:hypothetical protein
MLSDSVLDANMVPFWADVPVTAWLQMVGLLAAVAVWLTGLVGSQGRRC